VIGRHAFNFASGLFATIVVGWLVENLMDAEWVEAAKAAQADWMAAIEATRPLDIVGTSWTALVDAFTVSGPGDMSLGIAAPLVALWSIVEQLWMSSGIAGLVQLGLAALGLAVFNFVRSDGDTVFFGDTMATAVGMPLAIIALASVGGLVLWLLMQGALVLLGGISSLAPTSAAVGGIAGACIFCVREAIKKGAESALTVKLKV
jgi:hypothetical protein